MISPKSLLLALSALVAVANALPLSAVLDQERVNINGLPLTHIPDAFRFPPGEVGVSIVGGIEVDPPFSYEWTTPLKIKSYGQYCSVLGYPLSQLEVSVHRHDLRQTSAAERGADYGVAAIYVHPKYNSYDISFDVALWKLSTPVTVANPIKAIDRTGSASRAGLIAKALGWGATREGGASSSVLREVDVPIISQSLCNSDYYVNQIHFTHLCAGFPDEGGKDACQGDSGGPLVTFDADGNPVLVGITSWGYGCARRGYPGVYTNVTSVHEWVDETVLKYSFTH